MKQSFTLGAVSGITALAIGFPVAAHLAGAQGASDAFRWGKNTPLSQDDVQAMIDQDNAILLHIDAMVAIHKRAIQNHRIALEAAADITDDAERNAAVKAAHDAMRAEILAAIEANPELADLKMTHMGLGGSKGRDGPGKHMKMMIKGNLEEKFGMTAEELKAALDSGKTIEQIAEEQDVELPRRPHNIRYMNDEDEEVKD